MALKKIGYSLAVRSGTGLQMWKDFQNSL